MSQLSTLHVRGLHPGVTEGTLFELFAPFGDLKSIHVYRDHRTEKSLGYAIVTFLHHSDAERAMDTLKSTCIMDQPMCIMWSEEKSPIKSKARTIIIKNLHRSVDILTLFNTFSVFGKIRSCKVAYDDTISKEYGFVQYESVEAAERAIQRSNGMLLNNREVSVEHFDSSETEAAPQLVKFTSIYIKNISEDVDEHKLMQVFSKFGTILSARVIRCVNKMSRGFGFVKYEKPKDAQQAVNEMHQTMLNGKQLYVSRALKKEERYNQTQKSPIKNGAGTIIIKNLHRSVGILALIDTFTTFGKIRSCKVACDETISKRYGFVQYESVEAAERAIQRSNGMLLNNREVSVEHFDSSETEAAPQIDKFTSIYIKNIREDMDEHKLIQVFSKFGTVLSARVIRCENKISRGFGFVKFEKPKDAQQAVNEMHKTMLNGKQLYVSRALKKEERYNQIQTHPSHQHVQNVVVMEAAPKPPVISHQLEEPSECFKSENGQQEPHTASNIDNPDEQALIITERAMDTLKSTCIMNQPMCIMWSEEKSPIKSKARTIIIKNLHRSVDMLALFNTFSVFGKIRSCKVAYDETISKEYGFVQYESVEAAERAIQRSNGMLLNDREVSVEHFDSSETEAAPQIDKYSSIYIKNISEDVDEHKLMQVFSKFGTVLNARVFRCENNMFRGFGSVQFERPEDAQQAVNEMHKTMLNGKQLYVSRALKKEERYNQIQTHPSHQHVQNVVVMEAAPKPPVISHQLQEPSECFKSENGQQVCVRAQ